MRVLTHFLLWTIGAHKAHAFADPDQCAALTRHATGCRRLVEIGCWEGASTLLLRRAMAPDGILYAVDPYFPGRLGVNLHRIIARRETAKSTNGTVQWLRLTDLQAARRLKELQAGPVDFVFTDALNDYAGLRGTWEAWSPLVRPGGIYCVGTVIPTATQHIEGAGSVQFFNEVIRRDPRFELIETAYVMAVLRRRETT